ncbi:hypothetical protein H5410_064425, partial [Solanum commersonii]
MIRANSTGNQESTPKDLSTVQKSNDSIAQIERSMKANSGEIIAKSTDVRPQFRPPFDEINEISTTGESSPGQGVHHTEISTRLDGGIAGDIKSDQVTKSPVNNGNENLHQTYPCDKDNLPEVTKSLNPQENNIDCSSNLQDKLAPPVDVHSPGEELELIRITNRLNQGDNQDKNFNPIQRKEMMQPENEECNPKETIDGNGQGRLRGIQKVVASSKPGEGNDHSLNSGKSSNLDSNSNDHINPSSTDPNSRHNESGKAPAVVVIDGKQDGETQCATVIQYDRRNHLAPKIPPPLKVSSNFNTYRPPQQKTNQNINEQNQNKLHCHQ